MEGIFIHKKTMVWAVLLLCGLFFVALYVFLNIVDAEASGELRVFLLFGILLTLTATLPVQMNRGAYLRIEENAVHAKYHWFGRLDCDIDEVAFVFPQYNTLTILLKNGKRHVIMGLENPWSLSSAVRRQIFTPETEPPEVLREKLVCMQAARKKELLWMLGGIVLLFVNIFAAVFLTGGRELHEFGKTDWTLFAVMTVAELLTLIGVFYAAGRCGKRLLLIEQLKYRLKGAVILSQTFPSNTIRNIYIDENYTGRVAVCGFPNDQSVYYCVQEFNEALRLETVYTSEVYANADGLPEGGFDALIDITSLMLSQ